jgi:hypothetical protein|tara:strand:- start:609 stop:1145 length:537 start_codon:yes stop_codon:yes gene_type:complete
MKNNSNSFFNIKSVFLILILLITTSCGKDFYKPSDVKDTPVNVKDRVAKNMKEGRGIKLFGKNDTGGVFQFASSNPLWRASLEVLDFIPILNASYSGGLLITDWYDEEGKNESIKITVKFLSNEIRADALDISVYKKNCKAYESCQTTSVTGKISEELKIAILQKATKLKKEDLAKKN